MMLRLFSVTVAALALAAPALADQVVHLTVAAAPRMVVLECMPPMPPAPTYPTGTPYSLPPVQLMSADREDVLFIIDGMRAQLADFPSLALDNGISQTADAFVAHWNLAVETHVRNEDIAVEIIIDDLFSHNSAVIEDFLSTSSIPVGPSLFLDPTFIDAVALANIGGFFAN